MTVAVVAGKVLNIYYTNRRVYVCFGIFAVMSQSRRRASQHQQTDNEKYTFDSIQSDIVRFAFALFISLESRCYRRIVVERNCDLNCFRIIAAPTKQSTLQSSTSLTPHTLKSLWILWSFWNLFFFVHLFPLFVIHFTSITELHESRNDTHTQTFTIFSFPVHHTIVFFFSFFFFNFVSSSVLRRPFSTSTTHTQLTAQSECLRSSSVCHHRPFVSIRCFTIFVLFFSSFITFVSLLMVSFYTHRTMVCVLHVSPLHNVLCIVRLTKYVHCFVSCHCDGNGGHFRVHFGRTIRESRVAACRSHARFDKSNVQRHLSIRARSCVINQNKVNAKFVFLTVKILSFRSNRISQ